MNLLVEYLSEPDNKIKCNLEREIINVGSDENNEIIFKDNNNVSPNHALIILEQEAYTIYNHSIKGTYINKIRVSKAKLPSNGIIKVGFIGPIIKFQTIKEKVNKTNTKDTSLNRRWYDKNAILSKAIRILQYSKDENAIKVAMKLLNIINKQDINAIFIRTDINLAKEIQSLPRQCRWYDLNNIVQKSVESLKHCTPEMQEKLAIQIIMLLENDEDHCVSIETIKCNRCYFENKESSIFCESCGADLDLQQQFLVK